MLYGHIENDEDRADHLVKLRNLQDETGGFVTFIPLAFHPENTALQHISKTTGFADIQIAARPFDAEHPPREGLLGDDDPAHRADRPPLRRRRYTTAPSWKSASITTPAPPPCRDCGAPNCCSSDPQGAAAQPIERDTLYRPVERAEATFTGTV